MKTTIKHIAIFIATFALIFTSLPMEAHAVSTPPKVKTFNAKTYSTTSVRLTWKKPGKASGYAIYVNGKLYKSLPIKNTAYNVPNLKPGTAYKVSIKTYNTYKQKQYYNSKTKKWQTKKPSKAQWKGKKTRKVNARKYSKASVTRAVSTKALPTPPVVTPGNNPGTNPGTNPGGNDNPGTNPGTNPGSGSTTDPAPNLPSGKNTTGGVYDQEPYMPYTAGSDKYEAVKWAKANIPSNASDAQKVILAMNYAMSTPLYGQNCGIDAGNILYILDYVGIPNRIHGCDNAAQYGYGFWYSNHMNNLVWINGTPYVIDAMMGHEGYPYANGHLTPNAQSVPLANL